MFDCNVVMGYAELIKLKRVKFIIIPYFWYNASTEKDYFYVNSFYFIKTFLTVV